MIEAVRAGAQRMREDLVRMRRHLHAHPEASFAEHATAAFVIEQLRAVGVELRDGVAGTGIVALVRGEAASSDHCFALRADLDALPIQEQGDRPYVSRNAGWMHACGHDAHTAMVLGAARLLRDLRAQWSGKVLLVFQPGEERIPGGASLMLKAGALDDPRPTGIIGQHVTPELGTGTIGFHEGPFMASSDELFITVIGRGGHAARPDALIDPIGIAAHLLLALREEFTGMHPDADKLLAFGRVIADGATNVVPDEVHIAGTLRAFDEEVREKVHRWLPERAQAIARVHGGDCRVEVRKGYPVLVNDPGLSRRMRAVASELLGPGGVIDVDRRMGSEDFAFYTHAMPGCFMRLGTGNTTKGISTGLHTATFDIDEDALPIGCAMLTAGALSELAE
ncbi:MAG: amidohydrolase [Flavobacteriales bacterium]|nr:amidohydrolase [Flavobacteriales bacterium]MCB9193306.1 amidohydrolase [Flavobacteriales bacterium]